MEYLIGFYLIGVVMTSLYICAVLLHRKSWTILNYTKLGTLLISIGTSLFWFVFVGYTVYEKLIKKDV